MAKRVTPSRNKHGVRITRRGIRTNDKAVSIYAPDDLPASVKAVLKLLYPHSRYTKS